MALRVLLADESTTIKKVVQISLQDFGVDVKTVHVGTDVLTLAESYQPELILIDVLLQRKSGYEVCQELKSHPKLKNIPIILMWSGFMNVDAQRMKQIPIEASLEKPFEAEQLREWVLRLVPRLKENPVSSFLQVPKIKEPAAQKSASPQEPNEVKGLPVLPDLPNLPNLENLSDTATPPDLVSSQTPEASSKEWSMDSFEQPPAISELPDLSSTDDATEEPDAFVNVALNNEPNAKPPVQKNINEKQDSADWVQKDIHNNNFQLGLSTEEENDEVTVNYTPNEDKFEDTNFLLNYRDLKSEDGEPTGIINLDEADIKPAEFVAKNVTDVEENFQPMMADPEHKKHDKPKEAAPIAASAPAVPTAQPETVKTNAETSSIPTNLSEEMLEKILRSQSQEMIEKLIRKIVPEIAAELIQKELHRLIDEPPT